MPADDVLRNVYEDWRSGPWHFLGPENGPKHGHFYDSTNLQVYSNGTLGTRPKLKKANNTSITTTQANFIGALAYFPEYNFAVDDSNPQVYILEGGDTTPYRVDLASGTVTNPTISIMSPAPDEQAKPPRYLVAPQLNYGTVHGFTHQAQQGVIGGEGRITDVDDATPGSTAFTHPATWTPHTVISHRDRYWSWGDGSERNRIYYSVIGDITDWTNAEFFDIGGDELLPIVGVWQMYDSLLIAMKDLRWYIFRFADDPQYGEIRYIGTKRIPDYSVAVAQPGDSIVFLTIQGGITVVTPDSIDDVTLDYIRPPYGNGISRDYYFLRGLVASEDASVMLPFGIKNIQASSQPAFHKGDFSFDFVNGVWVKSHYWGVRDFTDWDTSIIDWFAAGSDAFGCFAHRDQVGGSEDVVYTREVTHDRPSVATDEFSSNKELMEHSSSPTTDYFQAEMVLEKIYAPEGSSIILEKVTVDFEHWKGGSFDDPSFSCSVGYEAGGTESIGFNVGALDPAEIGANGSFQGKSARATMAATVHPAASWIQVSFSGVDNMAFDRVTVEYRVITQDRVTTQAIV